MMRVCALAILCSESVVSVATQTRQLKNFDQLMFALRTGSEVRAIITYARCRLVIDSVETKAPDVVGGMSISTFEYFAPNSVRNPKGFVTASQSVLISHPRYGQVYNYVTMRIYEDNNVEITARYLNPTTYQILMDETFYGKISAGDDENAVCLFEN
ncbi:MAG: hypothetical protein Q8P51_19770 [Ignavibacteria bacterium]|nr:hypothetical protein [Ignavibacteria bacterium]